jgi:hypothetical protein
METDSHEGRARQLTKATHVVKHQYLLIVFCHVYTDFNLSRRWKDEMAFNWREKA